MDKISPGKRAHQACQVKYENINNSEFDGMSLASFCQSKAEYVWYTDSPDTRQQSIANYFVFRIFFSSLLFSSNMGKYWTTIVY